MANRSRLIKSFASSVARLMTDVVIEKAIEQAPAVIDEVKAFLRHPRSLGIWIEGKSPWLNRRFLGAASNWWEPFTLGMGFQVEQLAEEIVEVSIPGGWRNQNESGVVHNGALTVLGELTAQIFWEHHLDLRVVEAAASRVQVRILSRPAGDMKAVFRLPVADREAILHRLRADGATSVETQTLIYDHAGRLVAEVEIEWDLRRQLLLGEAARH